VDFKQRLDEVSANPVHRHKSQADREDVVATDILHKRLAVMLSAAFNTITVEGDLWPNENTPLGALAKAARGCDVQIQKYLRLAFFTDRVVQRDELN
jgi:hypothetical protein